jgi:predicted anti-sigma-YlaC factor YlaD
MEGAKWIEVPIPDDMTQQEFERFIIDSANATRINKESRMSHLILRIFMQPCRHIRKKLSAYQDGEVELAEKETIEAHLRTCEACRKQYAALLQTYRMLRSLPEIEPAPGLSRRIVDSATRAQEPFWIRALGEALRLLPAPAAMVTLAAAGLLVGTMLGNLLIEEQFHLSPTLSASFSDQALTLASVKVFDATPPGSFAEGYLKLTTYNPEKSHEK